MRHSLLKFGLSLLLLGLPSSLHAQVDESLLEVAIEPAFPNLEWPAWLTGEDEGIQRQLLPIVITGARDETDRLFIATQYGTIFWIDNSPQATEVNTLLDLRDRVSYSPKQNEEGFLGLAFHPQFAENGQLFVYYTPQGKPRRSVVSRFRISADDPHRADPDSEEVLLTVDQPYWNHNGGTIVFGPDGYLYIALGDGGKANDPHMHGQNLQSLLGKILRIDVDHQEGELAYAIPHDNPFAQSQSFARGEIWANGLRNVWRMSFDRKTNSLWAADVGQNLWEEVNIIHRGGNYGWNLREGKHPFGPGGTGPRVNLTEPIWEYGRDLGKSITGGTVYRGTKVPELAGAYLYADYVTGHIWALWYDTDSKQVTANRTLRESGGPVITFGEDNEGEVYFTSLQGDIMKFVSP